MRGDICHAVGSVCENLVEVLPGEILAIVVGEKGVLSGGVYREKKFQCINRAEDGVVGCQADVDALPERVSFRGLDGNMGSVSVQIEVIN